MFDFLTGAEQYPYTADYMQYIKPENVDDTDDYEGAVPFQFRFVSKFAQSSGDVNGLKQVSKRIVIRTKDSLPFDKKDRIMIREKVYTIDSAVKVENTLFEKSRILYENFDDYETEIELT